MKKIISIILIILIKSISIGFCMTPVMGRTSEDIQQYGENTEFEATFPFLLINSAGKIETQCSGSFVDVDGDIFFVTAAHCININNIEGVVPIKVKQMNTNLREIDSDNIPFNSSFRASEFVYNHHEVLGYTNNELEDKEKKNPLKIINVMFNDYYEGRAKGLPKTDLAFLSMDEGDVPSEIKPLKLYKGSMNKLMDQKVTSIGFGWDSSLPWFTHFVDFVKSLGCLTTGYYCFEEEYPRQAGDSKIFGRWEKENKLLHYPSESKDDIAAHGEGGDSGGPVLYKDGKGDLVIIGVISGGLDSNSFFVKAIMSLYYGNFNFKKAVDELADKGVTTISVVQFIEPRILERARFEKHGWIDAIFTGNKGLLLDAIKEGKLGVNHDSSGILLNYAILFQLWELAMELVHQGVSNVENFNVLYSLANKEAWEILDAVIEMIKVKAEKDENWIKEMSGLSLGLNQYKEERILESFELIFSAKEKKDWEGVKKQLDKIKETDSA